jgi:hypothetical protein
MGKYTQNSQIWQDLTMVIGACTVRLYLPGTASLKQKRGRLKPLLNQLRRRFEVAAAEIDAQDTWQSSGIAIVAVSNDASHIYAILEHAVHWIEENYHAVEILDWAIEIR